MRPAGLRNAGEGYLELAEETGWTGLPVTGPVFEHTRVVVWAADNVMHQHEQFFWTRVTSQQLGDVAAMHAADGIAAVRWWTVPELESATETIWPRNLPSLIRTLG